MLQHSFDPNNDIPDLAGKVILITGGTVGLGAEPTFQLAKHNPAEIYFTGRNRKAAEDVVNVVKSTSPSVKVTFVGLDLLSFSSIKAAQSKLPSSRPDILICNAGIMAQPPALSQDGYEVHTAESSTSNVRTVFLTSLGFRGDPKGGIVFKDLKTVQDFGALGSWRRYGQSKLANILNAAELARRYGDRLTAVSVHPGVINTGLVGNLGLANKALVYLTNIGNMVKPHEGAYSTLWAATRDKGEVQNGGYFEPVGQYSPNTLDGPVKVPALAKELWEWTEKELEAY